MENMWIYYHEKYILNYEYLKNVIILHDMYTISTFRFPLQWINLCQLNDNCIIKIKPLQIITHLQMFYY